jgi:hypothetical protein
MAFSPFWRHVDVLSVEEAAALWCEREPVRVPAVPGGAEERDMPDDYFPLKRMLISACETGVLKAEPGAATGLGQIKISRARLKAFAQAKKLYPAFLFDTLLPGDEEAPAPESVEAPSLVNQSVLHAPSVIVSAPKNKGGRPRQHDWDAMVYEIVRIADMDGLPATQTALVGDLLVWFAGTYGAEPAESEVKKRVSLFYNALKARGWQSSHKS